jgi:hypothetical protein
LREGASGSGCPATFPVDAPDDVLGTVAHTTASADVMRIVMEDPPATAMSVVDVPPTVITKEPVRVPVTMTSVPQWCPGGRR